MKVYEDCTEVREEFSALLDGELDSDEIVGVENHLSDCSECLRELDGLKKVVGVYAGMPDIRPPDTFNVTLSDSSNKKKVDFGSAQRRSRTTSYKPLITAAAMFLFIASIWGVISSQTAPSAVTETLSDSVFDVALVEQESPDNSASPERTARAFGQSEALSIAADAPAAPRNELDGIAVESAAPQASSALIPTRDDMDVKLDAEDLNMDEAIALPQDALPKSNARSSEFRETKRRFNASRVDNRDIWIEEGYEQQEVTLLKTGSPELSQLLRNNPSLAKTVNIIDKVIFLHEGVWYQVGQ